MITAPVPTSPQRRVRRPLLMVGVLIIIAVFAQQLAPYDIDPLPNYENFINKAPTLAHPFGTDAVGRDVFSRVLVGSQVSLSLAVSAVLMALALGTSYGAIAGLLGGVVDRLMMRVLDIALSIPRLLLLLAVTAFADHLQTEWLVLLLGITGWFDVARLVRGEVQALREQEFMLATVATGIPLARVFRRHVLPHLLPLLAVSASLNVANTIALESGLSYLGLGVQPPWPTWGSMLGEGSGVFDGMWWKTLFPGLATVFAVFACHALGNALRDELAQRQVPA